MDGYLVFRLLENCSRLRERPRGGEVIGGESCDKLQIVTVMHEAM